MKIAIDGRVLMEGRANGVSEYAFQLVNALLTADTDNEYWLFYNSSKQLNEVPTFERAQVVRRHWPNKLLNYGLFSLCQQPKISQLLGFQPDVWLMPHINFVALDKASCNIVTVHDLSFMRYPEFFSLKHRLWHGAIKVPKLLADCDQVVAISESTKADLLSLGLPEQKISKIYSGVPEGLGVIEDQLVLKQVSQRLKLPAKFILYLGTLEPRKNLVGLIAAYEQLCDQAQDQGADLVIAGAQGWCCDAIIRAWQQSRYRQRIHLVGRVAEADKGYLYNLADVFVYPSFYEGFGFPPIEALACGVPTVTSFVSSMPEVVAQAAYLVNPDDAADIAKALGLALVEGRKQLNWSAIKQQLEFFNWQQTAKNYIKLFS